MLDYVRGRPSASWRRKEVYATILLSIWIVTTGKNKGPRFLWIRRASRALERFAPWKVVVSTLTAMYAIRHLDRLVGLHAPDPPARLYSPPYFRAMWMTIGLDAGFATAMSIRPKWLRDIASIVFSVYYFLHGEEADEKLRKYRETCTVDFLRATWDKTSNPYIRAFTYFDRPRISIRRKILIPRPSNSRYNRQVTAWLFFAGSEDELRRSNELILDFPGGGFVAMDPTHHEERLRSWAVRTGLPILSVDYSKAPEYPYPYAIDEGFDVYRKLHETQATLLGMSGHGLHVILTGDSAGGNIAVNVMFNVLESSTPVPHPAGLALTYPALNFALTSWSWPRDPNVVLSEHENNGSSSAAMRTSPTCYPDLINPVIGPLCGKARAIQRKLSSAGERNYQADVGAERLVAPAGVPYPRTNASLFEKQQEQTLLANHRVHLGSRSSQPAKSQLTMASRAGYLHDRIISPSMMWAMAIMYLGPRWEAGLEADYHISPILAPSKLLAEFPPLLMQCGGKDPLVDDTMIFASRVREAKAQHKGGPGPDRNEDGVHMQIFPEWSHGYLQMPSIMGDARAAINDIADWISDVFQARGSGPECDGESVCEAQVSANIGERLSGETAGLKGAGFRMGG